MLIRSFSGFTCGGFTYEPNTAPYCESTATTTISKVWIGTKNPTGVPRDASFVTVDPPQRIWMNAVPIAWQSTDESIRARATASTSSSSTISQTPSTIPSSPADTLHESGKGLSTGAKIAIGVCVPLAAIVGILLAVCLLRHKKKASPGADAYFKAELPAESGARVLQDPEEMDATAEHVVHQPYKGPPVELPAQHK
jgi:hypothetical protein